MILAVPSALWNRIVEGIGRNGFVGSAAATFEISAIVWLSLAVAVHLLWRPVPRAARLGDWLCFAFVLFAALLPIGPVTWVAISFSSFAYLLRKDLEEDEKTAAAIFLAASFPMFWSRRLLDVFGSTILAVDAFLVSLITQTRRTGHVVDLPNMEGSIVIAAGCSSLSNVSVAILCWTAWGRLHGRPFDRFFVLWALVICLAVIAINIIRISLIGYMPQYYDIIHGAIGNSVVSWITTLTIVCLCYYGSKNGQVVRS